MEDSVTGTGDQDAGRARVIAGNGEKGRRDVDVAVVSGAIRGQGDVRDGGIVGP